MLGALIHQQRQQLEDEANNAISTTFRQETITDCIGKIFPDSGLLLSVDDRGQYVFSFPNGLQQDISAIKLAEILSNNLQTLAEAQKNYARNGIICAYWFEYFRTGIAHAICRLDPDFGADVVKKMFAQIGYAHSLIPEDAYPAPVFA